MPIETFDALDFDPRLNEALQHMGLVTPTPIQSQAIPLLLDGKDVLGLAQTGTGKTAAFILPILHKILTFKGGPESQSVRAVVLVPTRELANQVAETVRKLSVDTKISCQTVVGGTKPGPQIRALKKGQDLVVATPGRLEDHLREKVFSLKSTAMIVLDEADQMLDMGFIPAIRRIMAQMPRRKQAALFSATMPSAIKDLAAKFMYQPKEVSVAPANRPIEAIEQIVYSVAQSRKQSALIEQLSQSDVRLALVFVKTKRGADRVQRVLDKAGIASQAIHGDRSQGQRDRALKNFRDGRTRILIATDVAARGIDVPAVTHVFNFDLPQQAESYVHRIGRTARAGASGVAISFMNPTERDKLRDIEKLTKTKFKVIPLKVEDQTATINADVQAEQTEEEQAGMFQKATFGGKAASGFNADSGRRRDQKRRQAQAEQSFLEGNAPKKKGFDQRSRRSGQRQQVEEQAKENSKSFNNNSRNPSEDPPQNPPKKHRAILRDVDKDWEVSFEADINSADGIDTGPNPPSGKAKPKSKPGGKANKPNSKKSTVARAADNQRRSRRKAAKNPAAKPRGFIKKPSA